MKPIVADPELVAYCGLYCGACGAYRREKCPGCHENETTSWCKVRQCCMENDYVTCASCEQVDDVAKCKKYNNIFAKIFGLIFRSDRRACILRIREIGVEPFAEEMAKHEMQSIRRK